MSDEKLIAKAIHDVDCPDVPHCRATLMTWARYERFAEAAAAALFDAGRLLPEGGEERTEWEITWRDDKRGGVHEMTYTQDEESMWSEFSSAASLGAEFVSGRRRAVTEYPDGTVVTGPWREVERR